MTFNFPSGGLGNDGGAGGTGTATARRRGGVLLPTIGVLAAIVVSFVLFTGFYTDWLWFTSVDKPQVYTISIITRGLLFLAFGITLALAVLAASWLAYRTRPAFVGTTPEQASLERYREAVEPFKGRIALAITVIFGLFGGLAASSEWGRFLQWQNSTPFGQQDPQFGLDISFYTFELPFIRFVLGYAFAAVIISLLLVVVIHYLYGGLRLQPKGDRATRAAQVQISTLLAIFLVLKAIAYWLDRYELVLRSSDLAGGFTGLQYADANALLPALNILTFVALFVAALFVINIFLRQWIIPLIGLGLMILTSVIVGGVYPLIVQQFQVRPTEQQREEPFIQRNIEATREAYNIADAAVEEFEGSVAPPTPEVLEANAGTLDNIRLLDPAVVSPTYNQLQQIRGYYSFNSRLDVDRYTLDEGLRGAIVAAREINLAGIPDGQRNWTNEVAVFTHGYGVVAAYDNTALSNGTPDFFASDIPPVGELDLEQPRIYFGEFSPPYSIVGAPEGTSPVELDFPDDESPSGQRNNTYDGDGGVPMGSLFGRLLFATKFQDTNILLSDLVNQESQIMWDRDPLTRVGKVAPWLTLDQDPYPAVIDGRIKWIVDGYTLSNDFPYSSRVSLGEATADSISSANFASGLIARDQVNYMRNSVKAVVDAYEGSVTLYAWDESDPVLQTWQKAFPDVVEPLSEMPDAVEQHVRYPQDLFKVQRTIMARYHVTDPNTFYNGTAVWIVPFDPTVSPAQVFQPPYYLTLQMPDERDAAFSLTTTFAPQRRQTLAAFMQVNSVPGPDYGQIRVLQLPSNTTTPGPQQVQNNFESDPVVSSQLSLLRRGGSEIEFGNLLSLPFNDGLLYVEPVYLRAASEGYPLLRKVLVGFGANVALDDTLAGALEQVFDSSPTATVDPEPVPEDGSEPAPPTEPTEPTEPPAPSVPSTGDPVQDLAIAIEDAQRAYQEGQDALADGDFGAYGQAQDRLAEALERAAVAEAQITGQVPPPPLEEGVEEAIPEEQAT
ncbi:MAG TPA: UPF0182 family protein [Candidatus Nanopelagicales bacterium]|nr:UPF0182 family protein [Candidatus Nanopelagicales bacterium]